MNARTRPAAEPHVQQAFDALSAATMVRLEHEVALVAVVMALLVGAVVIAGHVFGADVPLRVLGVSGAFFSWYAVVALATRRGVYRPWMRYVSSAVDVLLCSLVVVIDVHHRGPAYALSSSAPAMYPVAVAAAALRLDWRLSLFAGASAAVQYLALMLGYVRPLVDPALLPQLGFDTYLLVAKALLILTVGLFGAIASRSMRSLIFRVTSSAMERERVRGLFGMYVSEEVVEHILSGAVRRGGERRSVTVLFSDIRGFTTMCESKAPEEVVRLLNRYFERMCAIVARHGGVVNKFLGDGMLVVFGAPAPLGDDAQRAFAAATAMVDEAARMSAGGEFPGLRIGVGLHRGEVVLGNVGGSQRQEYTAVGDTVNTAARVQDLTKGLGRPVLVTRAVADALCGAALDPLGEHAVRGRGAHIELFAPAVTPARDAASA